MLATRALESVFAFPNHGSNIHVSIHDLLNHEQSDGSFSHAQAYPYARYHAKSAIDERHSSRADERRDTEQAITIVKSWLTGQFSYGQELNTAIGLILTDSAIVLDLTLWYTAQVSRADDAVLFRQSQPDSGRNNHAQPGIGPDSCLSTLQSIAEALEIDRRDALQSLDHWLSQCGPAERQTISLPSGKEGSLHDLVCDFRRAIVSRLHAIYPAAFARFGDTRLLYQLMSQVLLSSADVSIHQPRETSLGRLLSRLCELGFRDTAQIALAHAMHSAISAFIDSPTMRVDWIRKQSVVPHIRVWIDTQFQPAVRNCHLLMGGKHSPRATECQKWSDMALDALGRKRTAHLLRYVQMWNTSLGAVLDLKEYIRTPEAKRHLADAFQQQLNGDLLHAGAQTSELLAVYINIIRVFKVMDSRNILLGRVIEPLRTFLLARDDTVKVIAASFLADVNDQSQAEDTCTELSREVLYSQNADEPRDTRLLDWDDMEWMPDPIDAAPDVSRSRKDDLLSHILRLADQERFNNEIRRILCNRLLKASGVNFEKETALIEQLKARKELDREKLKECEVMLRDMHDSARMHAPLAVTAVANSDQPASHTHVPSNPTIDTVASNTSTHGTSTQPSFDAKILSSAFWPALRDTDFKIPAVVEHLQSAYEARFTREKKMRKLQWLAAQGRATVELVLADRTLVFEGVHAWQASVIYAFASSHPGPDADTVSGIESDTGALSSSAKIFKTRSELAIELNMDADSLTDALNFWIARQVLTKTNDAEDTYTVLESLSDQSTSYPINPTTIAQAPSTTDLSAQKSQNALLNDNRALYETFILSMLTNGGSMDPERMAMMLSMVVPGGFEHGVDGVREICDGLVRDGKVEWDGGSVRVKK